MNEPFIHISPLHWKTEVLLVLDLRRAARARLAVPAAMRSCVNLIVELDVWNRFRS